MDWHDWRSHARTTGTALKNWFIAQCYDSLAVALLWLVGLLIIGIRLGPVVGDSRRHPAVHSQFWDHDLTHRTSLGLAR
jgi:hypothetical protein